MRHLLEKNKFIKIAAFLLAVIVLLSQGIVISGLRSKAERADKTYDIVIDYDEVAALAEQSDMDTVHWLGEFKKMGISKVGLAEESIMSLSENPDISVNGIVFDELRKRADWRKDYPREFLDIAENAGLTRFDVIVSAHGKEIADFLVNALENRIDEKKLNIYVGADGESAFAHIKSDPNTTLYTGKYKYMNSKKGGFTERIDIVSSKIMYISMGFLPEKIENIKAAGGTIVPRTYSYNRWNGKKFGEAVIREYERYGINPEYLIAGGEAVFGNDGDMNMARDYVIKHGVKVGLIENTTQRQNIVQNGILEAVRDSDYNAVRIFTVWNYIQNRYQYYGYPGAEEIENTLFRAVTERNVRLIYFKPFMETKNLHAYVTDPAEYERTLTRLHERLAEHGYRYDSALPIPPVEVPDFMQLLIGIASVLGVLILLAAAIPQLGSKVLIALGIAGAAGVSAAYIALPNSYVLLASFAACVVFGCMAMTYYVLQSRWVSEKLGRDAGMLRILLYGVVAVVVTAIIAVCGGIMTAAALSSTEYMLEIEIFRGVKPGQLLPIMYYVVFFFVVFSNDFMPSRAEPHPNGICAHKIGAGDGVTKQQIKDIINMPIKLWMVILLGVIAAIGYYYIQRTGHDSSIEVSTLEMIFRNKMEEILIARPRNKEFLFAFPSLMLMIYCAAKRYRLPTMLFGLFASTGAVSVINTFEHIRTPIALGFIRTAYSVCFGIILGIIAVLIFDIALRIARKIARKVSASVSSM